MRVFLSIDMLRNGTNPVLLLQPLIQWMTSEFLQDLKQRSREQNSPRKKTPVELRGGHTNIVAVEAKRLNLQYVGKAEPTTGDCCYYLPEI